MQIAEGKILDPFCKKEDPLRVVRPASALCCAFSKVQKAYRLKCAPWIEFFCPEKLHKAAVLRHLNFLKALQCYERNGKTNNKCDNPDRVVEESHDNEGKITE